jgi:type I restriction enzyme, S subunit
MREMKDSGIEWIGKIPLTWKVTKLDSLYTQRIEKVSDKDYPPLSVTMKGILPQLDTAAKTENGDDRKLVCVGDFAINSRSDRRGSCGISPYEGSVSLINTILKPRGEMNPLYYDWLFHSSLFSDEFYKWGHGIVDDLWTTRWQEMRNISVPSPELEIQQRIADYLNEKCAEIDLLITLQNEMIEKLTAYKQSFITEAVTKGLDPNTKFVPSGIKYIGDIPEGWKLCRIKNVARLFGRIGFRGYNSDDLNKDGIGAITLSPSNMLPMGMDYSSVTYLSWEKYYESPEIMIHNGDLLYVKTGSSYGKVSYVHDLPQEATINPQILRIIPKINNKYLGYYMQSSLSEYQTKVGVVGGTIPTISQEKINNFWVLLPTKNVQQQIVDYLDSKCADIDSLIAIKQQKIDKLQDYKKSVIYEAVTGKIEIG